MQTRCPHCLAEQDAPDEYEGKLINCQKCTKPFMAEQLRLPPPPPANRPAGQKEAAEADPLYPHYPPRGLPFQLLGAIIAAMALWVGVIRAVDDNDLVPLFAGVIGGLCLFALGTIANLLDRIAEYVKKNNRKSSQKSG